MSDSEQTGRSELKNPMRFSFLSQTVDISKHDIEVEELEIRPSEGNVYVHWSDGDGDE